jgi:hypothetical protein
MSATHDATQKLIAAIDAMTNSVAEVCVTLTRAQHLAQDVQGQQRARDAQIADAGIEVATARTREADKVARLRSRIVGLYRALRENQVAAVMDLTAADLTQQMAGTMVGQLRAELGNALRIGTQYREAAEQLQASLDKLHGHKFSERVHGVLVARAAQAEERAKRLEEIADQALDGWAELEEVAVANGIGNYSDHPAKIHDLRVKLHGIPTPPAEPMAEDEPDLGAQLVRVLEANGVDPHRALPREIQAAMDAVGMIGQVDVGRNPSGPSGERP